MITIVTTKPVVIDADSSDIRMVGCVTMPVIFFIVEILESLYSGPKESVIMAILISIALGVFFLHSLLWRIFGKEIIAAEDDKLLIIRKLLFLKRSYAIQGKDIQSIMENPHPLSQKRILIQCYGGSKFECGYNLDSKDLNDVFDIIELVFLTEREQNA